MAQSSKLGSRVHRLLDTTVRRESPTRVARIQLATGWCAISTLTTLLISCRTPDPVFPGTKKAATMISVSAKARPGNALLQFGLIEITETKDTLNPYLELAAKTSSAALASNSLRDISQRRGVDLLSLSPVREGQQVEYSGGPYQLTLSGEKSASGDTVFTKATMTVDGMPGPLSFQSLRIPNGGFVVLPGTYQPASLKDKSSRSRMLAIHASSHPLAGKSSGDTESFPLPGDASLPSGTKLISYEVHFIEKEQGVDWPGKQAPPTQTWTGEANQLLASLKRKRGISVVSYPQVTAPAGTELVFKSGGSWSENPQPSPPIDLFDSKPQEPGVFIKLCGTPTSGDGLNLDVDWRLQKGTAPVKSTAEKLPLTQARRLSARCFLSNGNNCALIRFFPPVAGKSQLETILMISTTRIVNP